LALSPIFGRMTGSYPSVVNNCRRQSPYASITGMPIERSVTSPIFTTSGYGQHHRWDSRALGPILIGDRETFSEGDMPSVATACMRERYGSLRS